VAKRFQAAIAQTFPQLGAVEFEHAWSGTMGFSLHRMPQVGEVVPGLWLASAFGAHGISTSAMAGELIAAAITEHDDRWRLFLPYELVWAGGRVGRLVQQVGAWSRGWHEEWASSVARRREAVRRTEAEQTGGVVAAPVRMTEPAPEPPGRGEAEPAAVPEVAEVESLLRRVASQERAAPSIPSLARTGQAPGQGPGEPRRGPSDAQNGPAHQPFTDHSSRSS
jgi:hypothetical protein